MVQVSYWKTLDKNKNGVPAILNFSNQATKPKQLSHNLTFSRAVQNLTKTHFLSFLGVNIPDCSKGPTSGSGAPKRDERERSTCNKFSGQHDSKSEAR